MLEWQEADKFMQRIGRDGRLQFIFLLRKPTLTSCFSLSPRTTTKGMPASSAY
jgi:hypothetical protein